MLVLSQHLKDFPKKHLQMYANAADISPIRAQTLILLIGYLVSSIPLGFHLTYTLAYLGAILLINALSVWVYGKAWLARPTTSAASAE